MSNPTSARRAPAADRPTASPNRSRARFARMLPAGVTVLACLVLAAAAAADGQAAAVVLALWVGILVVVGLRLSEPPAARRRQAVRAPVALRRLTTSRRPVLVLADMDENGDLGSTRTLPVVASDKAIAVLDSRPCG